MRAVGVSAGSKLAASAGPHSSVVTDVESSLEDVVEVPADAYTAEEAAVHSSVPQICRLEQDFAHHLSGR